MSLESVLGSLKKTDLGHGERTFLPSATWGKVGVFVRLINPKSVTDKDTIPDFSIDSMSVSWYINLIKQMFRQCRLNRPPGRICQENESLLAHSSSVKSHPTCKSP